MTEEGTHRAAVAQTRRRFMQALGGAAGGVAVGSSAAAGTVPETDADGTVGALSFYSPGSQLNANEEPLEDDAVALVRAEPTAFNFETTDGPLFVEYPDDVAIPVVSEDTTDPVVGFASSEVVADGNGGFQQDNEMFMLNLFDEKIAADGEPLVAWDEGHGQFWTLADHQTFAAYAEDEGYDLQASSDLLGGSALTFPSTASQVAPSGEDPLVDAQQVVVWAEETAENVDNEGDGAYIYESEPIPLVSKSGSVVGFGTPELANDGNITANNEQFLLNLLADTAGGSGTVVWDDAHDTFWDSSGFTAFADTIESEGYDFLSSGDSILESGSGSVDELEFFSTSSILDGNGEALTDASRVAVWAEETAFTNSGEYRNEGDPVGEGPDIPLVAVDDGVVAIGSDFAPDASSFDANRTMLVNAWEDRIGDTGTVLYDETHGQSLALGDFSALETAAEDRGFTVDAITEDFTGALDGADAVMVASSDDDLTSFSDAELDALSTFVADGGALFLHNTSDFGGDSSAVLNDVLAGVGADLQFNSDQVEDPENNGFDTFVPRTTNFNGADYPAFFEGSGEETGTIAGADVVAIPSPSTAYTTEELDALSTHVSEGGAVFLFDESEFQNEETANLNEIAGELGAGFAFNPDQVEDTENNDGVAFVPTTTNFNEAEFDLFDGIGSVGFDEADAVVITSPSEAFTDSELTALSEFVSSGGAVFLFDQADFQGFDETANLNAIAESLDLDFRFNSDQVNDQENNTGSVFDIATANYDESQTVFEERENGIGIEFDPDEEYLAKVVQVDDGDTFLVEFDTEYGYRDVVRHVGMDTAETGTAANDPFEWFGIPDDELDHLDEWGGLASEYALDLMAPDGSEVGQKIDGRQVKISFDENEPIRGGFGRLLAYMEYDPESFAPDPPEDGNYSVNYNRKTVADGYARVYSSGYAKHDDFAADEEAALADNTGLWGPADFDALSEYRTGFVDSAFVPRASSVTSASGPLSEGAILRASDTAQQEPLGDGDYDEYDDAPPLAAVDTDSRVAMFGGLLLDEAYEAGEDDDITDQFDLGEAGNFQLFTNTVEALSDTEGPFIVEGGHGQFGVDGGASLEDLKFYLRHVEGLSGQVENNVRLRQINDIANSLQAEPETPRAVFLTAAGREYTDAELDALAQFRDAGGAVVLVGSAAPAPEERARLNDIAAALGSDLRLNDDRVVDEEGPIDDPELLVTDNVDPADGLRLPVHLDREFEGTGVMAALDNVDTSAWTLAAASEDVGTVGEENPTLTFLEGARHHVENRGGDTHPLAFRDADGNALLTQDGTGSFEDDSDVNWVDTGDVVEFTLTGDLAAELDAYGCEVHSPMAGSIEVEQPGPPALPGFENPPQDHDDDGLYEDVAGTGELGIMDIQALFDNLDSPEVQNNAESFSFSGVQPDRVSIFDVQALFTKLQSN